VDQSEICLLNLPIMKLGGEGLMRPVSAGNHENPTRATIETMYDARTQIAVHRG
jgi:hypothetical protein